MKLLKGSELAGFIKERQARAVRELVEREITPKLAIVQEKDDAAINTYVALKQRYGADIGIAVDIVRVTPDTITSEIERLNQDRSVHGIIVQLPLENPKKTDDILNLVSPTKDVDGLAERSEFAPATPTAILWLLAGYNINLPGHSVHIVGKGRLVGAPLARMLQQSDLEVTTHDRKNATLSQKLPEADIVVSATGQPGLITADVLKKGAIVIDAGTASEGGKTVGDLAEDVYERDDLTVTPKKGGVGPLTVCALFENVIVASNNQGQTP